MISLALVLALLVPPLVGVPLVLADRFAPVNRVLERRGDWLLGSAAAVWLLAVVIGVAGWLA